MLTVPRSALRSLRLITRDTGDAVAATVVPGSRRPLAARPAVAGGSGRRPAPMVLGLLLVATCTLAGSELAAHAGERSGYVAVARFVPEGAVVSAEDLRIVDLSRPGGLAVVPASEAATVVGRQASEPLEPGTLLAPAEVSPNNQLSENEALVGTSLAADQMPGALHVGEAVLVVVASGEASGSGSVGTASTEPGGGSGMAGEVITTGTVYALAPASLASTGSETVTIEVPRAVAPTVTAASSAGEIALAVIVGGRS